MEHKLIVPDGTLAENAPFHLLPPDVFHSPWRIEAFHEIPNPGVCRSVFINGNDPAGNRFLSHLENPYRIGYGVTPVAGRSRVEEKDSLPHVIRRAVAVAVNDAVDLLEFPSDPILEIVGRTPAVNETDAETADFENSLVRDLILDTGWVHVPAHSHDFLFPEGTEDLEVNDVACMEDQFGVREMLPDDGQEPVVRTPEVCVGDNADLQPNPPGTKELYRQTAKRQVFFGICKAGPCFRFDFPHVVVIKSARVKRRRAMLENTLEKIAEKILTLDEASLAALWDQYKQKMEKFQPTREWERSVIVFFIINSVRVKNHIFNERIVQHYHPGEPKPEEPAPKGKPNLKLVK
jgi:hypothetical protein